MDKGSRDTTFNKNNYLSFLNLDLVKCIFFSGKFLGSSSLFLLIVLHFLHCILYWYNQLWYLCPTIRLMSLLMRELKAPPSSPVFWNYTNLSNQTLCRDVFTC